MIYLLAHRTFLTDKEDSGLNDYSQVDSRYNDVPIINSIQKDMYYNHGAASIDQNKEAASLNKPKQSKCDTVQFVVVNSSCIDKFKDIMFIMLHSTVFLNFHRIHQESDSSSVIS